MNIKHTSEDLEKFSDEIAKMFNEKLIKAPIHLDNCNEDQLIRVFEKYVNEDDYVCGTWRQHYKCLLKGVKLEELTQAILEGRSIGLCFPKYKILSSSIVGGIFPIGIGLAKAIKLKNQKNKVVLFAGEMSFCTGIARECIDYARNFKLPIMWVCEDNGKSVCTPTKEVYGLVDHLGNPKRFWWELTPWVKDGPINLVGNDFIYYSYTSKYPHAGAGKRLNF